MSWADADREARAQIEAQYRDARERFGGEPEFALAALMEQLDIASAVHERDPMSRSGVLIAFAILANFARTRGDKRTSWMFSQIHDQLSNLGKGKKGDPLVSSRFKGFGSRPRDSEEILRIKLLALSCVERLRLIKPICTAIDAQNAVARWLNDRTEFNGTNTGKAKNYTAGTLRGWQNTLGRATEYEHMRRAFDATLQRWSTRDEIRREFEQFGKPPS